MLPTDNREAIEIYLPQIKGFFSIKLLKRLYMLQTETKPSSISHETERSYFWNSRGGIPDRVRSLSYVSYRSTAEFLKHFWKEKNVFEEEKRRKKA